MAKIEKIGRHEVTVKKVEFGTGDSQKPFLHLAFENDAGDYIGAWMYFTGGALEITTKSIREGFGFGARWGDKPEDWESLPDQITNRKCAIEVGVERFNNADRFKVKFIYGQGAKPSAPIENAKSFFSDIAARSSRIATPPPRAPGSTVPKAAPAPKVGGTTDEDPFFPKA